VVSAFQSGRFNSGGSSDLGFATSTDGGGTWTHGFLPSLTVYSTPAGRYERVSDPAVAYDAKAQVWLISALAMTGTGGAAVVVSRSTDGGLSWSGPVVVSSSSSVSYDKEWVVCDNHASSAHFGNCYATWDDNGAGNLLLNSVSNNGGLSWGAAVKTAGAATGIGGQPLVQPDGTVIVPAANAAETVIVAYRSTDGGTTWTSPVTVSRVRIHTVRGGLRSSPLPTAEADAAGNVYVAWQDCRFRSSCASNDIVLSTSATGQSWSAVVRIPIDSKTSTIDHFIPGLAVDPTTSGASAHLALTYYFYPVAGCNASTCRLNVGSITSANGGSAWSAPTQLTTTPMVLSWLPSTTQGRMVGDYISTSFTGSRAVGVFAVAAAPTTQFQEAMGAAVLSVSTAATVQTVPESQSNSTDEQGSSPPPPDGTRR
jgi:hypothetical protein